jgi:hypothetical protein
VQHVCNTMKLMSPVIYGVNNNSENGGEMPDNRYGDLAAENLNVGAEKIERHNTTNSNHGRRHCAGGGR